MNQSPMIKVGGSSADDNDVVFDISDNAELFDTWQLGSSAGAMDVFVSGDGTNYQSAALALIDLGSTAPSTAVVVTEAGGNYGIRGRWKGIRVLQNGATAVANAYLIGYRS